LPRLAADSYWPNVASFDGHYTVERFNEFHVITNAIAIDENDRARSTFGQCPTVTLMRVRERDNAKLRNGRPPFLGAHQISPDHFAF